MSISLINNLKNKIWITRKCRINASQRLKLVDLVSKLLISYFTIVILSFSIWVLYNPNDQSHLAFITIIASLLIYGGSMGINSLNFKERFLSLKECYIELDKLYNDLEVLEIRLSSTEVNNMLKEFTSIRDKYEYWLKKVENHLSYDYLKFSYEQSSEFSINNIRIFLKYWLYNLCFFSFFLLALLLPFIPLFLI